MNFGKSIKNIAASINVGWKFCKVSGGSKPNCGGALLDTLRNGNAPILKEQLNSLPFLQSQRENAFFSVPKTDIAIRKSIIEPDQNIKIKVELPLPSSKDKALELPLHIEKRISEPTGQIVVIKEAVHMLRIRRRKMKKHKQKKHQRKFKIKIQNMRLKHILANEARLKTSVQAVLDESTSFSAENYVKEKLEQYNWVKPVTKVRGRLAPDWVIKKHLQDEEEKKVFRERIEECVNFKK